MSAIGVFDRTNPAVFETKADPATVTTADIEALVVAARYAPNGRARLILHTGAEDNLHEMVIALPPRSCDHPHINYKSGKSFLALSGQFAVMRGSDDGSVIEAIVLSAEPRWPGARMTRLRAAAWHTIIPLAGDTVFLETIVGPFTGNFFAEWFPPADKPAEREAFAEKLRQIARDAAGRLEVGKGETTAHLSGESEQASSDVLEAIHSDVRSLGEHLSNSTTSLGETFLESDRTHFERLSHQTHEATQTISRQVYELQLAVEDLKPYVKREGPIATLMKHLRRS